MQNKDYLESLKREKIVPEVKNNIEIILFTNFYCGFWEFQVRFKKTISDRFIPSQCGMYSSKIKMARFQINPIQFASPPYQGLFAEDKS